MKNESKETPAKKPIAKDKPINEKDSPDMSKVDEVLEQIDIKEKAESKTETEKEVKTKPIRKDGKFYRDKRKKEQAEAEAEREQQKLDNRKYVESFLKFISQYLSDRKGSKWKMTPDEIRLGSIATGDMLEKYLPKAGDYAVELTFVFWLTGYVGSRMDFKPTKQKEKEVKKIVE